MKKFTLLLGLVLACQSIVFAQHGGERREARNQEIQSLKIAFMTENLALTPSESEKFWPLYNKYWEDRVVLTGEKRKLYSKIESQTANQADLDALLAIAAEETQLMGQFATTLAHTLSYDKAAKTFVAEEKFKSTLLRRSQGKH